MQNANVTSTASALRACYVTIGLAR